METPTQMHHCPRILRSHFEQRRNTSILLESPVESDQRGGNLSRHLIRDVINSIFVLDFLRRSEPEDHCARSMNSTNSSSQTIDDCCNGDL